jgi:predicted nucleotidyltransferase
VPQAASLPQLADLRKRASRAPGLALLILHGSRARGDARTDSDWDFAFLSDHPAVFDPDNLLAAIAEAVGADRVDLADLSSSSALLAYRAARDGVLVFERESGRFQRFWLEAVDTWCDLAPILMPLYEHALETFPR